VAWWFRRCDYPTSNSDRGQRWRGAAIRASCIVRSTSDSGSGSPSRTYVDDVVQRRGIEVRGQITNGDSGGPVVTTNGEVIGIVYAGSRNRNGVGFAVDSTEIADVLAASSSTPVANGTCR
jgi:S1-C subfamily serine protease